MTIRSDGTGECDRCGGDIGNAAVDKAVSIHALLDNGNVVTLHLGFVCKDNCATRVLTKRALAHRQDEAPVTFYGGGK